MLPMLLPLVAAAATFTPQVTHRVDRPGVTAPHLTQGVLSPPLTGDLTQAARAFALANRELSGLPASADLAVGPAYRTAFGASFHFLQTNKGVEVYNAKVIVTVNAQRRVAQVASSAARPTRVLDAFGMDVAEAKRRAGAAVPYSLTDGAGLPKAALTQRLFPVGDELHAGYLAWVPTLDKTKNWYVALDAVTGEVLFTQNRMHYGATTANAWPVSPGGLDAGASTTPTIKVELTHADGGTMIDPADGGGYLVGDQIDATNCCVNEGCDADGGMKRVDGGAMFQGFNVIYETVLCDRLQRASNVTNASGSYEYTPVDPPTNKTAVLASEPANQDEFAEVHSFYHVNNVYDWLRDLSSNAAVVFPGNTNIVPFRMRDEVNGKKPLIWANVMFPNFNEILNNPLCLAVPPCRINSLIRIDNAAFMPVEQFAQIPIDEFNPGVDTLMIFQGNNADAAYDSTVIQHEFGHGAVYATANLGFDTLALDMRSANNESGALHEGFADYIAGAFNNLAEVGPYFGPRATAGAQVGVSQDSYLRSLDNDFKCPDVLWGEVHEDSQHVSGALWRARSTTFAGSDNGHTFDTAFYAMLVSIPPTADFAVVAAAMSQAVATAFPSITDAATQMNGIWDTYAVTNCSKVLDANGATLQRPYFGIAAADSTRRNALIPGPFQMKLTTASGPVSVRVVGRVQAGGIIPGQAAPAVTVMVRRPDPISFIPAGNVLNNNAEKAEPFTPANGALDGTVTLCSPGTDVYVALGSTGGGATITNLTVEVNPATTGCGQDAGTNTDGGVDAGSGTETTTIPGVGPGSKLEGQVAPGCGCTSVFDVAPLLGLAALAMLRRRRKA